MALRVAPEIFFYTSVSEDLEGVLLEVDEFWSIFRLFTREYFVV